MEAFEHTIALISNIVMMLIGIYTAYLTTLCKKIELIGYRFKRFNSDREPHYSVEVDIYNPSLTPKCIYGLYLVYNDKFFITVEEFESPMVIQARVALNIRSEDWWEPSFNMGSQKIQTAPIYFLARTNKGWAVYCYHELGLWGTLKTYIKGQTLKYKKYRDQLNSISYIRKDDRGDVCACLNSSFIEDRFIIQDYWGTNKLDK